MAESHTPEPVTLYGTRKGRSREDSAGILPPFVPLVCPGQTLEWEEGHGSRQ